jgi:hypothetical protein
VDGDAIVGSDVIIDWLDENAAAVSRRKPAKTGDAVESRRLKSGTQSQYLPR